MCFITHLLRLTAVVLATSLAPRPLAGQADSALDRGRRLSAWLLDGQVDSLYPGMAPAFQASIGGRPGLAKFLQQVRDLGPEIGPREESVYRENGTVSYYRIGRFETLRSGTLFWIWDSAGTILGLLVRPTPDPAPSKYAERSTRTPLRLPFAGSAYVAWGGRSAHQNYHIEFSDQRFAYDFFLLEDGRVHGGDGSRNEDYACFGREVLAPAAGRVRAVMDTVPDNSPGRMNRRVPPGNHVIIGHGHGEFSVLAHLRQGTVRVRPGQRVDVGQPLGTCGNSGNSSAPHLHYHLQTEARTGAGVGLPAQFRDYEVNGRDVSVGEPVRGKTVQAAGDPENLSGGPR